MEVENFVSQNIVSAKSGRRCIDGRYLANSESSGMLARPGGDFGYVEILLSQNRKKNLGLSPQQCFEAVYNAVTYDGGKFFMHTDNHAEGPELSRETEQIIGCGHIAKAMNPELASMYGVDYDDVEKALFYAREKMKDDWNIEMVNLAGEHEERGVLIIAGTQKTLNSFDGERMYFVYDQTRDEEFIEQLVPKLNIDGVTVEDFKKVSKQQTQATLYNLALGKPVFEMNMDENKLKINFINKIS